MHAAPTPLASGLELKVAQKHVIGQDIVALTLADAKGGALPTFSAGSHIDLVLETSRGSLTRQYSLCGDPENHSSYTVAVALAPDSRGGSAFIHSELQVGQTMRASTPRNHFELDG